MNFIRKPHWLKTNPQSTEQYGQLRKLVRNNNLQTICSSGKCPNRGECWNNGVATFMIAGDICTRKCGFCNTKTGKPLPLDAEEPAKIAEAIRLMQLKHAVITSVDRDDLIDGGAGHWVKTIEAVQSVNTRTSIEALIPDFGGKSDLIDLICRCKPEIISHNMETVKRLTPKIRSMADYGNSLSVIRHISSKGIITKSGIMLGLGETTEEVHELMDDLLSAGCSALTMGQYLQPSKNNIPVYEYISPERFDTLKQTAERKGFRSVMSGPLVRSSYYADYHFQGTGLSIADSFR